MFEDRRGRQALKLLIPEPAALISGADPHQTRIQKAALTGTTIGELPLTPPEVLDQVFSRARKVQRRWALTGFDLRKRLMLAFHDLVGRQQNALLDLIQWENGKSRGSAFEEVADVLINARYLAKNAQRILKTHRVAGAMPVLTHTMVTYQPRGVVGVISPWNYPLALTASDALAALMAGNAVVIKPDTLTPYVALAVKALLEKAGFPKDLFQVVKGSGADLGTTLIELSDFMMFTGSTATGRSIAERAGKQLTGFSAELGGKNPMIICADAPVRRAAYAAMKASFASSGQLCVSIERIYVHTDVWDRFVGAFLADVKHMRVAASMEWNVSMGPLISATQLQKVTDHVQDALSHGATLLVGGHPLPAVSPTAFEPTVLTDVTPAMKVFSQETFGPVVSLYRVKSIPEAIRLANDTPYGLNAAVWTSNYRQGARIAGQIQAGGVNINDGYAATWGSFGAPSGGMKASGMGHRHGPEGLLKYTQPQTIAAQHGIPVMAPPWLGEKRWARALKAYLMAMRFKPGR